MLFKNIFIKGIAKSNVCRTKISSFDKLANNTMSLALQDANIAKQDVSALFVGNMLSPIIQRQSQLASYLSSSFGFENIETCTIDGACGSGAMAFRHGLNAVLSGMHDTVMILGIELMMEADDITSYLAQASHWENEGSNGETFISLNEKLTNAYISRYKIDPDEMYWFSKNAHENAKSAKHAVFHKNISLKDYKSSKHISPQIRVLDACPIANGCCAIVLSKHGVLGQDPVVLGSDCKTDNIDISKRPDVLECIALRESTKTVLKQANITIQDVSLYETHDAYSIMNALSLEVNGFVPPGTSTLFARQGHIALDGQLPISTFGGLKARGHPVGATGVYQIAEIATQLTNRAGDNQIHPIPKYGLTNSFGGALTTVVSHVVGI